MTDGLLGPRAHEARIGPLSERQAERIEQDRFAGPGLAGQHAQTRAERQGQAVDQNDVADRQSEQHSWGLHVRSSEP